MKTNLRHIHFISFWLLVTLIYMAAFIAPEYVIFIGDGNPVPAIIKSLFISVTASGLLCLISVNRIVFALTFPILFTASAVNTYFLASIGTGISPGVVDLAMANSLSMWMTLVNSKLIVAAFFALVASILIAIYRWRCVTFGRYKPLDFAILGIFIFTVPISYSPRIRGAVMARMPFSFYNSVEVFSQIQRQISTVRTTYDSVAAMPSDNAPDVYFIIGESLRADHLPQNGYSRNTMPHLSADTSIVSYPNIMSDGHYTHICVPIIMTDTDSLNRNDAFDRHSFIAIFKRAGYNTAWFANQELSDNYAYYARETDSIFYCNNVLNVYNPASYFDTDILPIFDKWKADSPRLAVIHAIGSHWPYRSHYQASDAVFKPELESNSIISTEHNRMINSYDNTIIATDRFLSEIINRIKDSNAIMIFISDHGENLGEHGEYFHVNGFDETRNPACLIYMTEKYRSLFPEQAAACSANRLVNGNTDMMFHTAIDAARITTTAFNSRKSLLTPRRH